MFTNLKEIGIEDTTAIDTIEEDELDDLKTFIEEALSQGKYTKFQFPSINGIEGNRMIAIACSQEMINLSKNKLINISAITEIINENNVRVLKEINFMSISPRLIGTESTYTDKTGESIKKISSNNALRFVSFADPFKLSGFKVSIR